jgi:alpha-L-fucosidase
MQCWKDARFDIFIHWGVYSVPAYGSEWYARWMYKKGDKINKFHIERYGPVDKFGYKDLIPMFSAEKFDAEEWADLFEKSGAKFVMPVAEHHDGFQMYDSDLSDWNAKKMGPKRDVLGEIKSAVEKRNMKSDFIVENLAKIEQQKQAKRNQMNQQQIIQMQKAQAAAAQKRADKESLNQALRDFQNTVNNSIDRQNRTLEQMNNINRNMQMDNLNNNLNNINNNLNQINRNNRNFNWLAP